MCGSIIHYHIRTQLLSAVKVEFILGLLPSSSLWLLAGYQYRGGQVIEVGVVWEPE